MQIDNPYMPFLKTAYFRILLVALSMAAGTWLWARLVQPGTYEGKTFTDSERAALEAERNPVLDPETAHVPYQEVDYSEANPSWHPKGEAPILSELVSEGVLPPVEERVPQEPLVLSGPDGIGNYGGNWADAVTWDTEVWDRINKHTAGITMVRWSPNGYPIVPHIAKSWDTSEDLRVWTFHLRKGMKWSDGHPFTADDMVYWYEWEMKYFDEIGDPLDPHTVMGIRVLRSGKETGRLEKIDDYTVQLVFPHPNPFLLETLASTTLQGLFAPQHYLEQFHPKLGDQALIAKLMEERGLSTPTQVYREVRRPDNPEQPRHNAWIYRRYSSSAPQGFVRNPYYWAVDPEGNQLPYIDRITLEVATPDLFALKTAAGGFPAVFETENLRLSNYGLYMASRESGNLDVLHYNSGQRSLWTIAVNLTLNDLDGDTTATQKAKLLNNRDFRYALSYAINRQAIIDAEFLGMGEPAQADPGPSSPFHNERLYRNVVEYDPDTANALLDSIGLTQRDRDGYRTLPDGSPMVWYIPFRSNVLPGPFQFVIDDWAAIGIRAISRQVSDGLILATRQAASYEFLINPNYVDYIPVWDSAAFVPFNGWHAHHAPTWGEWYENKFKSIDPNSRAPTSGPPPGHYMNDVFDLYEQAIVAPTREAGIARFHDILDIAADELWNISIGSPPPSIAVVRNDFKNVPRNGIRGNLFHTPLNLGAETFYFEQTNESPGAIAQLKHDLAIGDTLPIIQKASVSAEGSGYGATVSALIRFLFIALIILSIVMAGWRHPYIGRRIILFIPMLFIISVATFTIIQIPPGDIIETRLLSLEETGSSVDQQEIDRIRAQFHLDESMTSRYFRWVGLHWFTTFSSDDRGLIQGDLGISLTDPRRPQAVNDLVGDRILFTVLLSLGTIFFTWALALPIGIYSAVKQYSLADYGLTFLGFIGMSIPGFLLALLIMYWGGKFFDMDLTGLFSPEYKADPDWSWGKVGDLMMHIWVPVIVLGVQGTASMIRIMRGNLLDELKKPYVTTARAKGVRPFKLILKYPVRVALNPFISTIGNLFPELISGGAIVAVVLGLPTVGPLLLDALLNEDIYLAGSMLVVLSLLGILGTLVSDLLLMWLDPRIRMERTGR